MEGEASRCRDGEGDGLSHSLDPSLRRVGNQSVPVVEGRVDEREVEGRPPKSVPPSQEPLHPEGVEERRPEDAYVSG